MEAEYSCCHICETCYCIDYHIVKNFRYLLPEHVESCHLRISYSAHTDLNIKFQSHRSRYTYLVELSQRSNNFVFDLFIAKLEIWCDLFVSNPCWSCRDYTNPYLPVNPSAIEGTMQVCFSFTFWNSSTASGLFMSCYDLCIYFLKKSLGFWYSWSALFISIQSFFPKFGIFSLWLILLKPVNSDQMSQLLLLPKKL